MAAVAAWAFREAASPVRETARRASCVPDLLCSLHDELVARARWLAGNGHDGWDLFQDTALRALNHATKGREEKNRAWLIKIMNNLFIDRCRASQTRTRLLRSAMPASDTVLSPYEEVPPEEAWDRLTPHTLSDAIGRLSEDARLVFKLHADGLPYLEIARRLNVRVSTVGTRLHRARRALREMLLDTLPEEIRGNVEIRA
jgi:RNA polymerase sigma-70 factor, ECF subfamily